MAGPGKSNGDDRMTASSFAEIAAGYANAVADNFRQLVVAQPEDQLKAPVGELLRATGHMTGLDVRWRTEVRADDVHGRPDLGVTVKRLLTGHVELKRPGLGARPERFTRANRAQWLRFKALTQPDLHGRIGVEPLPHRQAGRAGPHRR